MKHTIDYRVYYEDTDAGGIMYHGSYIRYCERGRTEFMRAIGHSCKEMQDEGTIFVIRHLEADYLMPAYLEDLLTVETSVIQVKNTSFLMQQTISRHNDILCQMKVTAVAVNRTGKPVRVPEFIRESLEGFSKV